MNNEQDTPPLFHPRLQGTYGSSPRNPPQHSSLLTHCRQGGESTFGDNYAFTEDLRRRVARALPKINVKAEVYPKYETRGDLNECVGRFRDW